MTVAVRPTFPRARYFVQRAEWEDATSSLPELAGAYYPDDFVPLEKAGLLELIEGDAEIVAGVSRATHRRPYARASNRPDRIGRRIGRLPRRHVSDGGSSADVLDDGVRPISARYSAQEAGHSQRHRGQPAAWRCFRTIPIWLLRDCKRESANEWSRLPV